MAFWSFTMYDADYFFVDNPLNRYTVSPRNDLKYNDDGSIDVYIQNESPANGKGSNWLPCSKGRVRPDAATVLAEGEGPFDHRRHLGDPACEASQSDELRL